MRIFKSILSSVWGFTKSTFWKAIRSRVFWFTTTAVVIVMLSIVLSYVIWDLLRDGAQTQESVQTCEFYDATTQTCESDVTTVTTVQTYESYGDTLRNIAILIGGIAALAFAIWRSVVAQKQLDVSNEQLDVAQRGLLNDRYQKGAEMLGNNSLAVRLGGIYALRNLDEERPEQYHVQIMSLLCAFVRHPIKEEEVINEDTQTAMDVIGSRNQRLIEIEEKEDFMPNLSSSPPGITTNLSNAVLSKANLSGTNLGEVNLSSAELHCANLSGADLLRTDLSDSDLHGAKMCGASLTNTDLSRADLYNANLSGAKLFGAYLFDTKLNRANLSGAILTTVQGLTQAQLDQAVADPPDKPPILDGVLGTDGKKLKWRDRAV